MSMSHEKKMELAWKFIKDLGITDSKEEFEKNKESYLVENVYFVRNAYYNDLEKEIDIEEDIIGFFERHSIKWE